MRAARELGRLQGRLTTAPPGLLRSMANLSTPDLIDADGGIVLLDWDTAGWGYLGEDLASLLADEADVPRMLELYQRCVPAYYAGFAEHADVADITDDCVVELILVLFGYRLIEWFLDATSPEERAAQVATLEQIHLMQSVARSEHRAPPA